MTGIESFEARRVLSIGNGGIHAVVKHNDGTKDTYLSLGTLTNVVDGKQQSYGRHYVNGSHLAVGEATLGVSITNARFVFDRIETDVVGQLQVATKAAGVTDLFKDEENYEIAFISVAGTTDVFTDKVNFKESIRLASSVNTDFSLTNLKAPLEIILFSSVDYCNELGIPLKLPDDYKMSANIDGDLKYNIIVRKIIKDVIFSKSSVGGEALGGFGAGVYDAICSDTTPWHFIDTSNDSKIFNPLKLSDGKKLSEFLK